jgi:hypothetical protein
MRIDTSPVRRFEWKYRVLPEVVPELARALAPHTQLDPYCHIAPDGAYPVRSLYYDTRDLRFYHETKDRERVRRKLRVRRYHGDLCFLEIKRKIDKEVVKERVSVRRSEVAAALDGGDPAVLMVGRPGTDLRTLERFRSNLRSLGLLPTALVAYQRRALVGRRDPHVRITLDSELCGRAHPDPGTLFENDTLLPFERNCVLELKFDRPVRWLIEIMRAFRLTHGPYSKYSESIDRCANGLGVNEETASSEASRS